MKHAIITKFLPATGRIGSRIKATTDGESVFLDNPQDANWTQGDNHAKAAEKLCRKLGWYGTLLRAPIKAGQWAWVFQHPHDPLLVVQPRAEEGKR